jgi:hypothetical protein
MTNWQHAQPGPTTLRNHIRNNFPDLQRIGIYNDRNIAGTKTKSHHAEGRALDVYVSVLNPWEKQLGDLLFRAFIDLSRSLGADDVIWNRQIWSTSRPKVRVYMGHNPHRDHVHIGFTRTGSQRTHFPDFLARLSQIRTELRDIQTTNATLT